VAQRLIIIIIIMMIGQRIGPDSVRLDHFR